MKIRPKNILVIFGLSYTSFQLFYKSKSPQSEFTMSTHLFKSLKKAAQSPEQVKILMLKLKKDEVMPDDMSKFVNLEELYIQGENLQTVKLAVSHKLRYISISSKKIQELESYLFELPNLETVNLKNCNLNTLPTLNQPNFSIKNLYVDNNVLEKIDGSIALLKSLSTLSLSSNMLYELPEDFSKLEKLNWLNVDKNGFKILPNAIYNLTNLKHLSLDQNPFSEEEKLKISKKLSIWF